MVILKNISGKSCWESSNAFPLKNSNRPRYDLYDATQGQSHMSI